MSVLYLCSYQERGSTFCKHRILWFISYFSTEGSLAVYYGWWFLVQKTHFVWIELHRTLWRFGGCDWAIPDDALKLLPAVSKGPCSAKRLLPAKHMLNPVNYPSIIKGGDYLWFRGSNPGPHTKCYFTELYLLLLRRFWASKVRLKSSRLIDSSH